MNSEPNGRSERGTGTWAAGRVPAGCARPDSVTRPARAERHCDPNNQHLGDGRVGPAQRTKEVRCLRPTCGDSAVPLAMHARAALPLDTLLTAPRRLVWQENGPQLGPEIRYSPCSSPTTSWRLIVTYYLEMPPRVPEAAVGRAVACAGCFLCVCSCRADRARKPELWKASGARSGAHGGSGAQA